MNETPVKMVKVAIALGSNIGDRMQALRTAVDGLAPYIDIVARSPVYETAPAYVTDQPPFLNAALVGETKLGPLILLRAVKDLENDLGRMPTFHYGPRAIDIDIIFYGDEIMNEAEITIPHPRMAEREFVLRPLNDIAPGWIHPENGKTVAEMLAAVEGQSPRYDGTI
ncbi:MAG: 2-amino-4-hydroxy-6-hydroxymethyldihydropteridine diphosphokinase [Bdellovibrionales bacterium]